MKQFNKTFLCKLIENTHVYEPLPKLENTGIYLLSNEGVISNSWVSLYAINYLLKRYGKKVVFE